MRQNSGIENNEWGQAIKFLLMHCSPLTMVEGGSGVGNEDRMSGEGKVGRAAAGEAGLVWGTGTWAMDWINYFSLFFVKYFVYALFIICVTTCSYILLH